MTKGWTHRPGPSWFCARHYQVVLPSGKVRHRWKSHHSPFPIIYLQNTDTDTPKTYGFHGLSACVSLVSLPDAFFNFVAGWLAHQDGGGTVPCQTVSCFGKGNHGNELVRTPGKRTSNIFTSLEVHSSGIFFPSCIAACYHKRIPFLFGWGKVFPTHVYSDEYLLVVSTSQLSRCRKNCVSNCGTSFCIGFLHKGKILRDLGGFLILTNWNTWGWMWLLAAAVITSALLLRCLPPPKKAILSNDTICQSGPFSPT